MTTATTTIKMGFDTIEINLVVVILTVLDKKANKVAFTNMVNMGVSLKKKQKCRSETNTDCKMKQCEKVN